MHLPVFDSASRFLRTFSLKPMSKPDSDEVHLLEDDRASVKYRIYRQKSHGHLIVIMCYIAIALIVCLGIWGGIDLIRRLNESQPTVIFCPCNPEIDGLDSCEFDEIEPAWFHPRCIDRDLTNEFSRAGPGPDGAWTYYIKKGEDLIPVNSSEVSRLMNTDEIIMTTHERHIVHCVFAIRKLARAYATGEVVIPREDPESHIIHCGHLFLSNRNLSDIDTKIIRYH